MQDIIWNTWCHLESLFLSILPQHAMDSRIFIFNAAIPLPQLAFSKYWIIVSTKLFFLIPICFPFESCVIFITCKSDHATCLHIFKWPFIAPLIKSTCSAQSTGTQMTWPLFWTPFNNTHPPSYTQALNHSIHLGISLQLNFCCLDLHTWGCLPNTHFPFTLLLGALLQSILRVSSCRTLSLDLIWILFKWPLSFLLPLKIFGSGVCMPL